VRKHIDVNCYAQIYNARAKAKLRKAAFLGNSFKFLASPVNFWVLGDAKSQEVDLSQSGIITVIQVK